jgi:predicted alpha/beta hydrolase family esterase
MKNTVILHGKPTKERYLNPEIPKPHEANWFPWIGVKLVESGIQTSIPPLPRPYFPEYETWKKVFEAEKVNDSTGLVGHSAGAEFILRWLSANEDMTVERVVLVAPYCDYAGKYGDFSNYQLDRNLKERVGRLTIINSLDDDEPIQRRTHELVGALPAAKLVELDGYGHFRIGHNMTGPEFPELLDELTSQISKK